MSDLDKDVDEAVGACKASVMELDHTLAIVCLIFNCLPFTSGVGTMVSACAGDHFNCTTLLFGILQLILTCIVVGWIWSIIHGIWLLDKSKRGGSSSD